jgi:hypothetical protein
LGGAGSEARAVAARVRILSGRASMVVVMVIPELFIPSTGYLSHWELTSMWFILLLVYLQVCD